MRHVDTLVAVENGCLPLVEVCTAIVVVVVIGWVGIDTVKDCRRYLALYLLQVVGIKAELTLLVIVQTIEADILSGSCSCLVVEGIGHAAAVGDASPVTFRVVLGIAIHGHTALEELLAVLENIFRHLAQVEVEVAAMIARLVVLIDEGVHHPELDVLDVLCLEVGIVELAHHAAPRLFGVIEVTGLINIGGEVVGTALLRIEGKVQHVEARGTCVGILSFLRIEFAFIDFTDVMA